MNSMPWRRSLFRGCTAVWLAAGAAAFAAGSPDIQLVDGVETMCGGRTPDEAAFLNMVAPRWAATLEFAGKGSRSAFPAEVQVLVRGQSSGEIVLRTVAHGPLLLARLPPGHYEIEAMTGGLTLVQTLSVHEGDSARARFIWPSNLDFAALAKPAIVEARLRAD